MIRIPGFVGAGGGEMRASEAAGRNVRTGKSATSGEPPLPIPLALDMLGVELPMKLGFSSLGVVPALPTAAVASDTGAESVDSALMVEAVVERPVKEFFRGPRWVSLNSGRDQYTVCHRRG
jgi:hypothetical protein